MRKNDLIVSIVVSLAVGGFFSILVPAVLASLWLRLDSNWFWLAPGWGLLKPGRDDGVLIFWATIISGLCYATPHLRNLVLRLERAAKQTRLNRRDPTNRWTRAAGACFAS